jgi:hypothetical protein
VKKSIESRRSFMTGLLSALGAGAVLSGCQPNDERISEAQSSLLPAEIVPLRPWMRSTTTMPDHVAAVRLLPSAGTMYAG